MRDIEGQATRVEASECGQRTSFNQPREAGDSVWETEHVRRMTLMHRTDRGRHLSERASGLAPHPERVYDWV
jgi:hypothetical protein